MDLNQARFNMIEQQIRPWEVLDPQVLDLLSVVRREDFAPLAHKALAFVDMEIPLGGAANQVMLAPRVQARLLQELALKNTNKVLEIGTGSGYMAALLAARAEHVVTVQRDYGNRVGIWRMMKSFERFDLKISAAMNAAVAVRYPALVKAFAESDPYVINGLVSSYRILPWHTVVGEQAATPVR